MNNAHVWINAGYELFAREGLEGLPVERMARILGLNKSGYYHYFGNLDTFLESLLRYHAVAVDSLASEISGIKQFDPEFIHTLLYHKRTVMAHLQLARNRHHPLLKACYTKTTRVIDQAVAPTWTKFIGTPDNPQCALKYFDMVRDVLFSRLQLETFNFEFIQGIVYEAKEIMESVTLNPNFSSHREEVVTNTLSRLITERI
jgi:AcrR family transcriptional regulator